MDSSQLFSQSLFTSFLAPPDISQWVRGLRVCVCKCVYVWVCMCRWFKMKCPGWYLTRPLSTGCPVMSIIRSGTKNKKLKYRTYCPSLISYTLSVCTHVSKHILSPTPLTKSPSVALPSPLSHSLSLLPLLISLPLWRGVPSPVFDDRLCVYPTGARLRPAGQHHRLPRPAQGRAEGGCGRLRHLPHGDNAGGVPTQTHTPWSTLFIYFCYQNTLWTKETSSLRSASISQLAMGVLQVGFIVMYLSDTLVSGFTTAAAVHILVSQLKFVLGLVVPGLSGPLALIYVSSGRFCAWICSRAVKQLI